MLGFICGIAATLLLMGFVESIVKPFSIQAFHHNLPEIMAQLYDKYDNWAASDGKGSVTREQAELKVREWLREITGQEWNKRREDWIVNKFRRGFDPFIFASKQWA